MDKAAVLNILSRFKQALEVRNLQVQKLVLFGSYATGTAHAGSDIDVLVISDDFSGMTYWERTTLLAEVVYDLFEPLEAIAMTNAEYRSGSSTIAGFASLGETVNL